MRCMFVKLYLFTGWIYTSYKQRDITISGSILSSQVHIGYQIFIADLVKYSLVCLHWASIQFQTSHIFNLQP